MCASDVRDIVDENVKLGVTTVTTTTDANKTSQVE